MYTSFTHFPESLIPNSTPTKTLEQEIIPKHHLDVSPDFLEKAMTDALLEQQVIVHCQINPGFFIYPLIRIWPTTFLKPKGSSNRSKLLHAFNISFYPEWLEIYPFRTHVFTLIFEGLPKDTVKFDLEEEIPEPGGFFVPDISRNASDVYKVKVN
ncbi:hypothetical protein [Algoriphagus limi]|uniref:Uncharacterized protein n=1 Tax=Algoriphagus limi TaxID=2975273 RepID=A0ABT2G0W4_9BACT|nr:hypothetical protein [Algoriphagus limi]MCS5488911.1 hypothetical protein [Algoriphagus limi]